MRKIQACDSIKLNYSIDEVWNIITDIPSYQKWWPKVVKIKVSNYNERILETEFEVKPLNGQSFSCRIETIYPMEEIKLYYFDGIYRGYGIWIFKEKENSTILSYEVDLIILNKLIILISYFLPVSKIHSLVFQKIFIGLQKYLCSRQH